MDKTRLRAELCQKPFEAIIRQQSEERSKKTVNALELLNNDNLNEDKNWSGT